MDLKKLAAKAKKTIDDRGGVDSLKADAEELKKVAKGEGSLGDKAKRAAQAIKHREPRSATAKCVQPRERATLATPPAKAALPTNSLGESAVGPRRQQPTDFDS